MATEFKLPDIGEGTAEGEIIKWLVSEGDMVAEDDPLVEVMTDKATVEIPSPRGGKILEIQAEEGDVVEVGAVIMLFGEEGEEAPAPEESPTEKPEAPEAPESSAVAEEESPEEDVVEQARAMARAELEAGGETGERRPWEPPTPASRVLATPATRRLARELGVELDAVAGTGKGGRIMKEDVEAAAARAEERGPAAPTPPGGRPAATEAEPREREERIAFRGLRRKIAERMVHSKTVVPHYTYVEEADMTEVVALRRRAKEMGAEEGVRVTYLPFIIQAVIRALQLHPIVNAALDEDAGEIVVKRYYNIGIATATERGLMVPVVKDADRLSIFDLAREIERLAGDAREGNSSLEDLQGGTFTITSTGNIGGLLATPVINHPEVAILGVTAIRKRPVVRGPDDDLVVRHMTNLSLSLDHRVVDGAEGALFMRDLVRFLEDPTLQLLGTP